MGSGHAKYSELLQKGSKNTLIHALYRAFQGQKGHHFNLKGMVFNVLGPPLTLNVSASPCPATIACRPDGAYTATNGRDDDQGPKKDAER